ncbi:ABC transporter ATP-binding protein [Orenia metallireducens]|uniref:ABC transporter ATP-binding protein n=1 Tax=Orenia metallireducens TaxID=1413210 RepID=A0A1C0A9A7_9FIRM|nr:ATP-binding cassette domain-containing protein [Orenia metallireducens]OCL26876.1 ABC transporter ATP-binding protein [Orenia metallireducens]
MFSLEKVKFKNILEIDSLEFPDNKITTIIGPSGAGKSTLLKLLNNMVSVDSGTILYKGEDINQLNPVELRREVIMLAQNAIIFGGSIKDNLEIGFRLTEEAIPEEEELKKVLKVVHLSKGLTANTQSLSGGEKQRLALARVLLLNPKVLLLDEPSSALDQETERLVIETVVNYVRDKGKTLIMITHSKDIALEYGDKIITLQEGRVIGEEEN